MFLFLWDVFVSVVCLFSGVLVSGVFLCGLICFQWSGFVSVVWFCFGGMILFQWYDLVSVV